jgi:peptidoglycan/LPS O-acetylase OafA/YrhL
LLVYAVERRPKWSEWAWLGWLGRVSYCVYLVHLPLAVLLRPHLSAAILPVVVTALSCSIAAVSWRYWEAPWLALRDRHPTLATAPSP